MKYYNTKMRHHQYNPDYNFVKAPVDFNKYTDRSLLHYCLGATIYVPGTKDFAQVYGVIGNATSYVELYGA